MAISRTLAVVIIAGTSIAGVFIGRVTRNNALSLHASAPVSPAPTGTTPADDGCRGERVALASIKAQLAACMTIDTATPETAPPSAPDPPAPNLQAVIDEEIRSYQERLESLSEAVIVRHSSGIIRVYKPVEWPTDGDGVIIGRKFSDGHIERYPLGERSSAPH